MTIASADLAKLTFGKAIANTAIRWLPFFLPALALAFDSSTAELAILLGVAEASGLTTLLTGRWLDAGRERLVLILALGGVTVSSLLALTGSFWLLAAALVILGASSGQITVAGHAWISARVEFARRARFIGIYEISWASALLVGVPIVAALISAFSWRAPFIAVAAVAVAGGVLIATIDDGDVGARREEPRAERVPITPDVWLVIGAAAGVAIAGLSTIAVAGTWLDEVLGVSTGGVGLVAVAFGIGELIGSTGSSAFADRLGKRRSVMGSLSCTLVGLVIVSFAGTSLVLAAIGLFVFFVGFEYSIVTTFSLVSEAMPEARGQALGVGNAGSTLARGIGVAAAGILYERYEIIGPIALSCLGAVFALSMLVLVGRRRPDLA